MKDQVRMAFEAMTEAPHPALRDQLRARLLAGPPRPIRWYPALAAVAAVIVVALALGYAVLVGGGRSNTPVPAIVVKSSPLASPSPSASPPAPSPSPSAPPDKGTGSCSTISGGAAGGSANLTDVRVGTAAGYDRFVLQFDAPVPDYTVTVQDSPTFIEDASGRTLTLQGSRGVAIRVAGASGAQTYTGSQDLTPGYPSLREARRTGDFERVLHWGLGIGPTGCARVTILTAPDRLVVDIAH